VQRLQRGDLAVIEVPFRQHENVKVAAFRPPVAQGRGPGDVDAAGDPGESCIERSKVLVERGPRLVRQDFRSGWHVPETTGGTALSQAKCGDAAASDGRYSCMASTSRDAVEHGYHVVGEHDAWCRSRWLILMTETADWLILMAMAQVNWQRTPDNGPRCHISKPNGVLLNIMLIIGA